MVPGCVIEFAFGRRDAALILKAVLVAEDTQVDVAALYLVEVHLIRAAVAGRQFLEQENLGNEAAQDGIAEQESLQVQPLLCKFFLHTTDENSEASRSHVG